MEKTQLALERRLPELRDLEHSKLFTHSEVVSIARQRRTFESELARRDVRAVDFVRYIEYEQKLERLRKIRYKKVYGAKRKRKSVSDFGIVAHITQLYTEATKRFPGNVSLWTGLIRHGLSLLEESVLVSRTVAAAIALHPRKALFWLIAVRWEVDIVGDVPAGRRVCMRALRHVTEKNVIYEEWIRVEVAFAEMLRQRSEILGGGEEVIRVGFKEEDVEDDSKKENEEEEDDDSKEEDDNSHEQDQPLPHINVPGDANTSTEPKENSAWENPAQKAILEGALVQAVAEDALKQSDYSPEAHRHLILYLRKLKSPITQSVLDWVYSSLYSHSIDVETPKEPQSVALKERTLMPYLLAVRVWATRHVYDLLDHPPPSSDVQALVNGDIQDDEASLSSLTERQLLDALELVVIDYSSLATPEQHPRKKRKMEPKWTAAFVKKDAVEWLKSIQEEVESSSVVGDVLSGAISYFQ